MTPNLRRFDRDDSEMLERVECFKGFFQLDRFVFRHRRFDGGWSRDVVREIFVRGDATCILPYDPIRGQVVLIEQFRAGALLSDRNPWLLELVAGINEEGETPEDVAHREADEEAGITLAKLERICEYFPSPGGSTEKVHLYCACVDSRTAGGIHGLHEEDEDIRVHVLSLDDAMSLVDNNEIDNAPAIIALQWLWRHRERLGRLWPEYLPDTVSAER